MSQSAGVRAGVCLALAVAGTAIVLGCLLALRLEAQGFGRPRDTGMRPGYVLALAIGAAAGVAVPTVASVFLLQGRARPILLAAAVVTVLVCVLLLGVTT